MEEEKNSKLKSLMVSSFMSLSKVEQDILRDIVQDTGIQKQQEQKKDHIKIISKHRFYEILNRADEYINQRDKDYLIEQYNKRGLSDKELIVSNRETIIYIDGRTVIERIETKINCDNPLLEKITSHLYVSKENDHRRLLEFVVNKYAYPGLTKAMDKFVELMKVSTIHKHNLYEYDVTHFVGIDNDKQNAIIKYWANVVKNGDTTLDLDNTDRVMRKEDLLTDKTVFLTSEDFSFQPPMERDPDPDEDHV